MDLKKQITFLRENFIFYLAGLLVILGLKCYYRQADCDSLLWILAPTARWVEILSKIPFTYIMGTGYVNHSLRLLIAPSCSGVRFMIITFATLYFSFVHMTVSPRMFSAADSTEFRISGVKTLAKGAGWIAVSAFLSWLFTIVVNGLRIIVAIYLPLFLEEAGLMRGVLTPDRLHTMIGVIVYFAALLTIYRLAGWFIHKMVEEVFAPPGRNAHFQNSADICPEAVENHFLPTYMRKCAPPVLWYFALTLGLPFISRVYKGGAAGFAEFAALVIGCGVFILLPYAGILFLRRQK